jgi:hypothetical protein
MRLVLMAQLQGMLKRRRFTQVQAAAGSAWGNAA